MINNEQLNSLFSAAEDSTDYEEEKRRKKQKLVRNEFEKSGKYGMPLIKKQNIDLDKIELLSYLKTKNNDEENKNKTIHFFTYDWNFESVYEKPEQSLEKLDQYSLCLPLNLAHIRICHLLDKLIAFLKIVGVVHFGKNKECLLFQQSHGARMIVLISFAMVLKKVQLWLSQPTQEKITKRVLWKAMKL